MSSVKEAMGQMQYLTFFTLLRRNMPLASFE